MGSASGAGSGDTTNRYVMPKEKYAGTVQGSTPQETASDLSFRNVITVQPAVVSGEKCHVSSVEKSTGRYPVYCWHPNLWLSDRDITLVIM